MLNTHLESLKKRSEFIRAARIGKRYSTPCFFVQAYRRTSEGTCRYGITASRKVGPAVDRNRAKRRLRALIKPILLSDGQAGIDYVFIARKEILKKDFSLLVQDLKKAIKAVILT